MIDTTLRGLEKNHIILSCRCELYTGELVQVTDKYIKLQERGENGRRFFFFLHAIDWIRLK